MNLMDGKRHEQRPMFLHFSYLARVKGARTKRLANSCSPTVTLVRICKLLMMLFIDYYICFMRLSRSQWIRISGHTSAAANDVLRQCYVAISESHPECSRMFREGIGIRPVSTVVCFRPSPSVYSTYRYVL
jgi:hypothetical protein